MKPQEIVVKIDCLVENEYVVRVFVAEKLLASRNVSTTKPYELLERLEVMLKLLPETGKLVA